MLQNTKIASGVGSIYVPSDNYEWYISANGWSSLSARIVSVQTPNVLLSYSDGLVYGSTIGLDFYFYSYLGIQQASVVDVDLPELKNLMPIPGQNPPKYAFASCSNLKTVKLDNLSSVPFRLFTSLKKLETVDLPKCKYIDKSGFAGCSALSSINLPECSYLAGATFTGCSALSSINLPECGYLGSTVFEGCSALSSINLPKCSYLSNAVFANCTSLTEITLGSNSVVTIGGGGINLFLNVSNLSAIYVPASLVDAYKSANVWSKYSSLIFPIPE